MCEASVPANAPATEITLGGHGGAIVEVTGGPRFEVVRNDAAKSFDFFAIDSTVAGKSVVIENPEVVVTTKEGMKTFPLVPIEGETRAWRLTGFTAESDTDANLRFSLDGKALSTSVRLGAFRESKY